MGSGSIPIHIVCDHGDSTELTCSPKVAYENYLQDFSMFQCHGISHVKYVHKIVDKQIDNVNKVLENDQYVESDSSLLNGGDVSGKHHYSCPIPNGIWGHLNDDTFYTSPSVSHDLDISDKTRCFLIHRDLVTIS